MFEKKGIDWMRDEKRLKKLNHKEGSHWALSSFAQAKKTSNICVLTDFWKINTVIEQNPFPLPHIAKTIQKI